MDPQDYLSKPLKQSHLIQCIVKYAAMSGAMQEHKHKSRRSVAAPGASAEAQARPGGREAAREVTTEMAHAPTPSLHLDGASSKTVPLTSPPVSTTIAGIGQAEAKSTLSPPVTPQRRPGLANRGFTENPRGMESPAIVSNEDGGTPDPFDRLYLRSNSS